MKGNIDLSPERLLAISKELDAMPPKPDKSQSKTIQVLEPAIRKMIEKRYTLKEICSKLNDDLQIKITSSTLSTYLTKFEAERKKL